MKKPLILIAAVLLTSCANSQLLPNAELIRIAKNVPNIDKYEYLGEVSCSYPGSFSSVSEIIKSCRNDLKNQAAQKSGSLVVIETEQIGSGGCGKCITMFGSAYKKKE